MSTLFANEAALKKYIMENTDEVFDEKIRLVAMNLPGETGRITPDLVGYDVNGNLVIVEVKLFDPSPRHGSQYYKPREAIGQMIHYAVAYVQEKIADDPRFLSADRFQEILKKVHLFIIGDVYSESVEKMCSLLDAYGINITYLSLDCV